MADPTKAEAPQPRVLWQGTLVPHRSRPDIFSSLPNGTGWFNSVPAGTKVALVVIGDTETPASSDGCPEMYPVIWTDDEGESRNTWSRNRFTNEIQPDPDGDPMYTTTPPPVQ